MVRNSPPKLSSREKFALAGRELARPVVILHLIVLLTAPWWTGALCYFFLWTYSFAPSGPIPWLATIVLGVLSVWALISFFQSVNKRARSLRELRKLAQLGEPEASQRYLVARKESPSPRQFLIIAPCVAMIVPAIVAIILMSGDERGLYLVRENGKLRRSTRQEDLHQKLLALQKRGIYTPIER